MRASIVTCAALPDEVLADEGAVVVERRRPREELGEHRRLPVALVRAMPAMVERLVCPRGDASLSAGAAAA